MPSTLPQPSAAIPAAPAMAATSPTRGAAEAPPRRAARKTAAERQSDIGAAAEAIALESGLSAVTMRAVGARVGITPSLVVHHVATMDALVAAAFDKIVGEELREVALLAGCVPEPADRLRTVLEALLDGGRTAVTLVWVEAWVLGRENTELAQSVRAQMDAWRGFLAGLIDEGCRAGRYRVDDSLAVAGQLLGMIDGVGAHSLVGWQDDENRAKLMLRAAEAILGAEGAFATSR